MQIVTEKITRGELQCMAKRMFGNLVKAVVDVEREIMVVDAELHADQEAILLENGSRQQDLWGINIYPEMAPENSDFIEFDSMINIRPSQNNNSRGVENPQTQKNILSVVKRLIV